MGLDLRLLPIDGYCGNAEAFSHTILNAPYARTIAEIFTRDGVTKPQQIPLRMRISAYVGHIPDGSQKDELGYGDLGPTDAYGERYTWIEASMLAVVLREVAPDHPVTAYISVLDGNKLVVLDWH